MTLYNLRSQVEALLLAKRLFEAQLVAQNGLAMVDADDDAKAAFMRMVTLAVAGVGIEADAIQRLASRPSPLKTRALAEEQLNNLFGGAL